MRLTTTARAGVRLAFDHAEWLELRDELRALRDNAHPSRLRRLAAVADALERMPSRDWYRGGGS